MQLQPFHQRRLLIIRQSDPYPNYARVVNEDRWWPLYRLLGARFRGNKGFTDYEVGRLIALKGEYEEGVGRKG
jgi:hypothetical protein